MFNRRSLLKMLGIGAIAPAAVVKTALGDERFPGTALKEVTLDQAPGTDLKEVTLDQVEGGFVYSEDLTTVAIDVSDTITFRGPDSFVTLSVSDLDLNYRQNREIEFFRERGRLEGVRVEELGYDIDLSFRVHDSRAIINSCDFKGPVKVPEHAFEVIKNSDTLKVVKGFEAITFDSFYWHTIDRDMDTGLVSIQGGAPKVNRTSVMDCV